MMPSMDAACASCGMPATMSPMAYRLRLGGLHVRSHVHEAAFELRVRFLQAEVLASAATRPTAISTCSAASVCACAGLVVKDDRRAAAVLLHRFDFRLGEDLDAALAKGLLQFRGNFFVLERHDARQHLENA